jgi:hypothetical protein
MKENLLPVATRVFDIRFGWGEIMDSDRCKVEFKSTIVFYDKNGKYNTTDINPTLSLTEYSLENGGFTPLSDYNKPKVGDWGFFWDEENDKFVFAELIAIDKEHTYPYKYGNGVFCEKFSKEIPEFIKEKLGNNN